MKSKLLTFIVASCLTSISALGAAKAQFHIHCLSVRFQPATTTSLGLNYTLELTTDSPTASVLNGELAPLPMGAPSSHGSYYRLSGDIFFEPVNGTFGLNLPEPKDENRNGIADFFEVSQAVSAITTTGGFEDFERSGKVTTTWSREANSPTGTCRLNMEGYGLTFNVVYEVLEFSGALSYTGFETNVTGSITLTNKLDPKRRLVGRVDLDKVSPDLLALRAGTWTNEVGKSFSFFNSDELDRVGTNYVDFLLVRDGELSTSENDYVLWLMGISDPNDANGNGIPDLSDGPAPRSIMLSLAQTNKQLLLSISGEVGKTHDIERISALGQTNWTLVTSLTLTNDPQAVALSPPTNGIAFWRVRVR